MLGMAQVATQLPARLRDAEQTNAAAFMPGDPWRAPQAGVAGLARAGLDWT